MEFGFLDTGPRVTYVTNPSEGSDSSDADVSSSEDEDMRFLHTTGGPNTGSEYWHIQKLVKYIRIGNPTACNVSLCILRDQNLSVEDNQLAIRDTGGLEVLVNLLETGNHRCRSGALQVMNAIASNPLLRRDLTDLGAVPLLVTIVGHMPRDLQIIAAETLAKMARVREARRFVRKCDGIHLLIELMEISDKALFSPVETLHGEKLEEVAVARAGAKAIWTMTMSRKNVSYIMSKGCIKILARCARSVHTDIALPVVATLQECASKPKYRTAIQAQHVVPDFVNYLTHSNMELVKYAAAAIFKCAVDKIAREEVGEVNGLLPLVNLIKSKGIRDDKRLLAAVTGAIWKCSLTKQNLTRFDELRTVPLLTVFLDDEDDEVLTNVAGALSVMCERDDNRQALRIANGLPLLVNLLNFTHEPMLANCAIALGECANNAQCMLAIEELDGVRLIWSLLKNPDWPVQAAAAGALVPCVRNAFDSGEMVRSFVGGLELIVSLLKSKSDDVLTNVCAAISQVAQDKENLAIITDHGVVGLLAQHVSTENNKLRAQLARAIAYCCPWGKNGEEFGRLGTTREIVTYMGLPDAQIAKEATIAVSQLSADPLNCIELHACGAVPYLLITIGSKDDELQQASAVALANMRKLALEAENFKLANL